MGIKRRMIGCGNQSAADMLLPQRLFPQAITYKCNFTKIMPSCLIPAPFQAASTRNLTQLLFLPVLAGRRADARRGPRGDRQQPESGAAAGGQVQGGPLRLRRTQLGGPRTEQPSPTQDQV